MDRIATIARYTVLATSALCVYACVERVHAQGISVSHRQGNEQAHRASAAPYNSMARDATPLTASDWVEAGLGCFMWMAGSSDCTRKLDPVIQVVLEHLLGQQLLQPRVSQPLGS